MTAAIPPRGRLRAAAGRLASAELWVVGLLVLASLVLPRLAPAALAVGLLYWPVRWLAYGRLSVSTPGDTAAGLLVLTVPVTLWATALPDVTRPQVLALAAGVVVYYATVNWTCTAERERLLVFGLVAAGLLLALVAPISVAWFAGTKLTFIPEAVYNGLPRLVADSIHPNVMAGALAQLWPIPLALLAFDWTRLRRAERLLCVAAVLAIAAMLVLTKSRGALLAAACIIAALCVLRWHHGWWVVLAGALAAELAAWRIGLGPLLETLSTTASIGGLDGRLEVWSRAIFMLQDFPFTGIGMGTFKQVANAMYPFFLAGPNADVPHAHNLFLQIGADLGLPGLVAWLALLILSIASAWAIYSAGKREGNRWAAGLGAGLLCSQLALVVHGLLDAATWGTRPAVLVWVVWAVAAAGGNLVAAGRRSSDQIETVGVTS